MFEDGELNRLLYELLSIHSFILYSLQVLLA